MHTESKISIVQGWFSGSVKRTSQQSFLIELVLLQVGVKSMPLLYLIPASPCSACCCDTILFTPGSSGLTVLAAPGKSNAAVIPLERE